MTIPEMLLLAVERHRQGRIAEAEQLYRQVLYVDPLQPDAHHLLGVLAMQVGRADLAVESIEQAIRSNPGVAVFYDSLGDARRLLGQIPEAIDCYRQALALDPNSAKAYGGLGVAYLKSGRFDEAIVQFQHSLDRNPYDSGVLNNLGVGLLGQGQVDGAIEAYRRAIEAEPRSAEAHHNLGVALLRQKKAEDAAASFRRAVELKPDYVDAHNNLGNALHAQDRFDEAIECYRRAAQLRPDFADAQSNIGNASKLLGRWDDAFAHFEASVRINPSHPEAHANLGLLHLLRGDFPRGWAEYEWRTKAQDYQSPRRDFGQPLWDGGPLDGRTILLHAEQGLGDTLQFARFAALVRERGGRVVFLCQPSLVRLVKSCRGIDDLRSDVADLPPFDVHAPLLELPRLLGIATVSDIPAEIPYLAADPALVAKWRPRLDSIPGFRVGIAWQGEQAHLGDRWRSVSLERFAPLAAIPGVSLVSLQKGAGSEQLQRTPSIAVDLASDFADMADTAAVVSQLDLVVSVDTAPVHLAGALGVPTWIALPFVPDWRWLLDRSDSPWYPTVRLFRQHRRADWDDVFERLAAALHEEMVKCSAAQAPL